MVPAEYPGQDLFLAWAGVDSMLDTIDNCLVIKS